MGETSGGPLRFVRQETPITPQRLPRFGIEGNEALRAGSSRFLEESDAGEAGLQTESENFRGNFYFYLEKMKDLSSSESLFGLGTFFGNQLYKH